jgi:eukaryotic-like serine/threonine-protein kinase
MAARDFAPDRRNIVRLRLEDLRKGKRCGAGSRCAKEIASIHGRKISAEHLRCLPPAAGQNYNRDTFVSISSGSRLEGYEVVARLGSGGMGEIWLARDLKLERMVALKVLRADLTQDATRLTRFRQEARAASSLNHPNVCTIHALGETPDGQQFIAMEHVAGDTLRQRLAGSRIPLGEALDIAVQVASALNTAHAAGVVHRDLKPENVMLRPDGLVKVVDFGLAKLAPVQVAAADATLSAARTDAGIVVGTVRYMSPEQTRGQDVDARTDIWSVGVMLYEMIAGRHPFAGQSSSEVLAAILDREPVPIARFEPDAPRELQRIVSKTLRKDREQRYQVMKDLLLDLQALRSELATQIESNPVEHEPTQSNVASLSDANTARSQSSAEYVVSQLARHKLGAALTACALLLIGGGGWWTVSRRGFAPHANPSVAVLPFSTIGSGDGYFADGITEAVTTELGKVGGLRVIASNTAFGYRDKTAFREIARELGVGLVVRGSVQRAGGTVRIDVSLVDTHDDTALWSERYSREVTDVLTVQDDISRQIATTLSRTYGAAPTAKPPSLATRNPEAYDAYLRGVWHLKGRSSPRSSGESSGTRRLAAIKELEQAVAHDPNFALARAALASAYTQRFFYDATDPAFEQEAFLEIQRALAINPDQAEAYLARAQLTWNLRNRFPHEQAITDLRRALSINPNLAEAYVELGKVYYHIGLTDRAVDANEQAQRLDPSEAVSRDRRLRALIDAARLEEVRLELDRIDNPAPYSNADALVAMGQFQAALQILSRSRSVQISDPESDAGAIALLGVVYARLGRREDAERMLAAAIPAAENPTALSHMHHAQFQIGATLGLLGRYDEAVRWLTKAADEGYPSYPRFSRDQSLAPLKGRAGFEALLARLRRDWDRWVREL